MTRCVLLAALLALSCGPSIDAPPADGSTGPSASDATGPGSASATEPPPDSSSATAPATGDSGGDPTGDSGVDPGDTTEASADSTGTLPPPGFPSRLLVFYTPHGYYQQHAWSGSGEAFSLGPMLAPLEPWKDHLLLVEGIANPAFDPEGIDVQDNHSTASSALLTGGLLGSGYNDEIMFNPHYAGGPSLDVVLGEALSARTPLSSVHLGVRRLPDVNYPMGVSYVGYDMPNPPMVDPELAFEAMFAGMGGEDLDALHSAVTGISPDDPAGVLQAHLSLAAAAFVHDVTRVQLVAIDTGVPRIRWQTLGLSDDFHFALVENNPELVEPVYAFWGESLATLLAQLEQTPHEGGGSLLDSTLVVWVSELGSVPAAHTRGSVLVVIVDASGVMATGQVAQVEADQADLAVTLATALGVDLGPFGHPSLEAAPIAMLLRL